MTNVPGGSEGVNSGPMDLYRSAFDSALAGMAIADLQGELRSVNPAFLEMWGYEDEDDVVGRSVIDVCADPEQALTVVTRVIGGGEWEGQLRAETRDGETFHTHLSASAVTNAAGEPVYIVCSFVNVSDRGSNARRLDEENERLDRFASVVSHDLRNPLQVAEGRIELARSEYESEHLAAAATALERAGEIVDEVLTQIREGVCVDEVGTVDLEAAAAESWRNVPTEGATLTIETSQQIRADESSLKRLLENLLRNAVEHGGADVTVRVGDLDRGFYVGDDGRGIPPTVRGRVFDAGYSSEPGGTGFGLRITERIADAHGWEVDVTTSEDGGARFEVTGVETVAAAE